MGDKARTYATRRVIVVGTYIPRQCGIATFTADLCESMTRAAPCLDCRVVAMTDNPGYAYPARVCFEIPQNDREQYDTASDFINLHRPNVVCIQHE
ncbi:MAG: hypothetical protein QHH07_06805 [Sedimentisphaerales bacterium]|jgi:hypothetical protein|nr:hypothetical protein [Sedimentisphaerales bacterium]